MGSASVFVVPYLDPVFSRLGQIASQAPHGGCGRSFAVIIIGDVTEGYVAGWSSGSVDDTFVLPTTAAIGPYARVASWSCDSWPIAILGLFIGVESDDEGGSLAVDVVVVRHADGA